MKFDEILPYLGEFGTYQKRIYFLVCLPAVISAFLTLSPVFILYSPRHRCSLPGVNNDTYIAQDPAHAQLINQSIPYTDGAYSKCTVYVDAEDGGNVKEQQCDSWVYDTSPFTSTIVEELDLVCQHRTFRSHANMVVMLGKLAGAFGQSVVSDIFGRKKSYMFFLALMMGSGFLNYFIQDFASLLIIRFISGCATTSVFVAGFVIGMELVAPSKRVYAGMIIEIFWVAGMLIMAGVVYFLRDWQHIILALSCPPVLFVSYWWLMPESPRWLLAKGRKEEAIAIIKKAAEVNKVTLPAHLFDGKSEGEKEEEEEPKGNLSEMFTNRTLATRCLIIFYLWAVASLTYYGLTLNVSNLSGDIIINFVLSALVELAGYILTLLLLNKLGRKILQCGSYLIGGLACVATIFPVLYGNGSANWALIMLSLIGKMGSSASFAVIYIYTAELYPTPIRNTGVGASSVASRIGGVIAPYVADLGVLVQGQFGEALPLLVFGATAVLAGVLSFCLPETLNRPLPETIEDAKNFSKKKSPPSTAYELDGKKPLEGHVNGVFRIIVSEEKDQI